MKKAGIITFHNAENYGATLQTYALMTTLQTLGCETTVIDYRNRGVFQRNLVKNAYYLATCQNPIKNHRAYKNFQKNYLHISHKTYKDVSGFKEDADQYDFLFFGSDQIWNPDLSNGFDEFYFGQFPSKAKKIAYGASVGKDSLSPQEQATINQLLENFDAVSVREETILPLINRGVNCVVDPCMLLSAGTWRKIASNPVEQNGYILVYQLHPNKIIVDTAVQLAESLGKKILLISPYLIFQNRSIIRKLGRITPNEFLAYYDRADIVLSDSFHGTIFSILFEKIFFVILPSEKTGRITSLLNKLDLSNRIVHQDYLPQGKIDYAKVNELVSQEVQASLDYIRRNIA